MSGPAEEAAAIVADAIAEALDDFRFSLMCTGRVTGTSGQKVIVEVRGATMTLSKMDTYTTPVAGDVVSILTLIPNSWLVIGRPAV